MRSAVHPDGADGIHPREFGVPGKNVFGHRIHVFPHDQRGEVRVVIGWMRNALVFRDGPERWAPAVTAHPICGVDRQALKLADGRPAAPLGPVFVLASGPLAAQIRLRE
jgi:hypothetical protein